MSGVPPTASRVITTRHPAGPDPVPVTVSERGRGRPVLLLHGGAGPQSVTGFADLLAQHAGVRVIVPTHPGFEGTPRPEGLQGARELAAVYAALLEELDLDEVTVVGNSLGGWVAAEIALTGSPRIAGAVLVDAAGLDLPAHPVADVFSMSMAQIAELTFHDPGAFAVDPASLTPAQQATMAANGAALFQYAGTTMTDPSLRTRLAGVGVPTLVLWGDADQMIDVEVGRAYAAAVPGARFQLLQATGHMPQLETPEQVVHAVTTFVDSSSPAVPSTGART